MTHAVGYTAFTNDKGYPGSQIFSLSINSNLETSDWSKLIQYQKPTNQIDKEI